LPNNDFLIYPKCCRVKVYGKEEGEKYEGI
jgi:hypothetical protein